MPTGGGHGPFIGDYAAIAGFHAKPRREYPHVLTFVLLVPAHRAQLPLVVVCATRSTGAAFIASRTIRGGPRGLQRGLAR